MSRERRSWPLLLLKLLVTLGLLTLLLWRVDWSGVLEALGRARPSLIALVFAAMVANVFLSAFKWKVLLSIHGTALPYGRLYRYYFSAFFLNNFLPSNIGGDGYRIYKTIKDSGSKAGPVLAVFMERASGLGALALLGLLGGAVTYLRQGDSVSRAALLAGMVGIGAGLAALLLLRLTGGWNRLLHWRLFPAKLRRLLERFHDYRRHPGRTALVIVMSLGFHLLLIGYRLLLVVALGESCSYASMAVVVAVSSVVALVPISLNGIGLLDGSYVFLLSHYGVPYETALVVMILIRTLHLPLSLLGGLFYFLDRKLLAVGDLPREEIEAL